MRRVALLCVLYNNDCFLPLLRGRPCPVDTHAQIGLRSLQHVWGLGSRCEVGMGAASECFVKIREGGGQDAVGLLSQLYLASNFSPWLILYQQKNRYVSI